MKRLYSALSLLFIPAYIMPIVVLLDDYRASYLKDVARGDELWKNI